MSVAEIPVSLFTDPPPLTSLVVLVGLAVVPFALLAVSSFIKISVVLNILRSAIGAQQLPSGAVISLLSLVLTCHIMSPTASRVTQLALEPVPHSEKKVGVSWYLERALRSSVPIEVFLRKNSHMRERLFFAGLSRQGASEQGEGGDVGIGECDDIEREAHGGCVLSGEGFFSLVPAFVLSELSEAFAIGFRIFLPFLVVDLIIAHLLLALGMSMLNPITVSLPFKLLLLVLSDGWFLLCQGLVEGYR